MLNKQQMMKDLVNHLFKNIVQVALKNVFQIGVGSVEQFNGNHFIQDAREDIGHGTGECNHIDKETSEHGRQFQTIYGKQYSRMDKVKFFKGCLP